MTRRYRLPFIVDLTLVDRPEEIRALAATKELDRRFEPRGPLVNRLVAGRIRRWFQISSMPLPSLAPRGDAARAGRQQSLFGALQPGQGEPLWSAEQLSRLADYLAGRLARDEMAITVQEIIGRRFDPGYLADRQSWAAAEMIDHVRDRAVSLRQLVWLVTGKLRRARQLLVERAGHDRHAMHGTAIGVHGIVHALERMRVLLSAPYGSSIAEDVAVSRCLHPPRRVPRTVEATLTSRSTAAPLPPGAIVMFQLEDAWARMPDAEMVFMHRNWAFCPAESFIPALLRAAWRQALHGPETLRGPETARGEAS